MTDRYRVQVGGQDAAPATGWTLHWLDRPAGIARLARAGRSAMVVIEGRGSHWFVTVDGRRVPVAVRTRREQLLADAEVATRHHAGPIDVHASLPGLVVALSAGEGDEVAEGDSLVTIEAMKMQNEVRAPRAGTVSAVAVSPGQPVATGTLLMRIE